MVFFHRLGGFCKKVLQPVAKFFNVVGEGTALAVAVAKPLVIWVTQLVAPEDSSSCGLRAEHTDGIRYGIPREVFLALWILSEVNAFAMRGMGISSCSTRANTCSDVYVKNIIPAISRTVLFINSAALLFTLFGAEGEEQGLVITQMGATIFYVTAEVVALVSKRQLLHDVLNYLRDYTASASFVAMCLNSRDQVAAVLSANPNSTADNITSSTTVYASTIGATTLFANSTSHPLPYDIRDSAITGGALAILYFSLTNVIRGVYINNPVKMQLILNGMAKGTAAVSALLLSGVVFDTFLICDTGLPTLNPDLLKYLAVAVLSSNAVTFPSVIASAAHHTVQEHKKFSSRLVSEDNLSDNKKSWMRYFGCHNFRVLRSKGLTANLL